MLLASRRSPRARATAADTSLRRHSLQVICRMPGNLVSPRPECLGDQHRYEEGGHGPPAAKDLKEATGQRPSLSGHLDSSLTVVSSVPRH
jgi:hypothetical protein